MQSIQNIKSRMRSVKNIGQITKAMELVAATKMRRAQETALASRPYAVASLKFLSDISRLKDVKIPPLLEKRAVKKTLFVLVTSDKGLAGSFNSAVLRKFENHVKNSDSAENLYAAIGQKAAAYLQRKSLPLVKKFTRAGDFAKTEEINPIADFLIDGYLQNEWDKVVVFSTHFRSALKQEPLTRQILPVEFENIKQTIKEIVPETGRFSELAEKEKNISAERENLPGDYLVEPSPEEVLDKLAAHLVFMQIYHIILEANASEHSARRLAMKNASDNASGLSEELNLEYNKSRQAGITREILEITSGAEALK